MPDAPPRLSLLPVSLFAAVMGTAGAAVAWERAETVFEAPPIVSDAFAILAAVLFIALVAAYATKAARHFAAVTAEWTHPVKMAFVPTISIAAMVLSAAIHPLEVSASEPLWWLGAGLQVVFTVAIVRAWISGSQFSTAHIHPGWFIPAVGNIVAPLAGQHYAPGLLNQYFFAVGIVYWLALFPMVLSRLVASDPLPKPTIPTLAILIAPPAVGASAWVAVWGQWGDIISTTLLAVAVFQAVLLASQLPELLRAPFGPSAWAYTFPLAALASALLAAEAADGCEACLWFGIAALAAVTFVILTVLTRSALDLAHGTYLKPDPAPAKK